MTYSEEEIKKYLSILQNFEDGLDVYTPVIDKHIPPKIPQKVSCENCGNTHFFLKIKVSVTVTNVFILLVEFLSRILLPKIVIIFRRKVFTRGNIIINKINLIYEIFWISIQVSSIIIKMLHLIIMLKKIHQKLEEIWI